MFLGENSILETYYDILSVKEDATYEEIRASYRSAVLNSHPDKLKNPSETSRSTISSTDGFLKLQKAWEILSNTQSRAIYDNDLQASRQDGVTADEINIEDMTVEDTGGEILELYYQCRCGDHFLIDSSDLSNLGCKLTRDGNYICLGKPDALTASIVIPCGSCSLKIRLWVDSDIKIPSKDEHQP